LRLGPPPLPAFAGAAARLATELTLPESPLAEALGWVLAQPDVCRPAEAVAEFESEAARRLLSAAALTEAQAYVKTQMTKAGYIK